VVLIIAFRFSVTFVVDVARSVGGLSIFLDVDIDFAVVSCIKIDFVDVGFGNFS
jgi:hypothetical protein